MSEARPTSTVAEAEVLHAKLAAAHERLRELDELREALLWERSRAEIAERAAAAARAEAAAATARLESLEKSTSFRAATALARRLRWARKLTRRSR